MRRLRLRTLLLMINAALVLLAVAALGAAEAHHLVLALGVAAFALLFGVLLARQLAGPVRALTTAAARIGRGDLETPMPRVPEGAGAEVATLAATMEEMRRRLFGLTGELRRRQAEAETILSGIAFGVFAVDRDRRVRYLNPQAAALLGIPVESALGRFCGDVLRPEGVGPEGERPCDERCPIVHARFRGIARATEHLTVTTAAGETRRTVVITSSQPTEDRQFQVLRDETETEATRRLRDTVLANISHEFKTPLAAQLASIELLRDRLPELESGAAGEAGGAAELVGSLERGTLRLTQLIDNLLESVRIEAGETGIRRRPVALDEVVEQAVELMSPLLGQRGQRLTVDLPYPLPAILGDAPRLTQVFVNLLANANKFAPEGSTIALRGAVRPEGVALEVEDEGPGLPTAGGALFERFVRSAGEEPAESGMGLGLWIVKSIVERHGGRVEAESRRDRPGTRMRVVLPRAPGDIEARAAREVA